MSEKPTPKALPTDPESRAMLQILSQVVGVLRDKGLRSLVIFAVAGDGDRIAAHHLTDTTDFVVLRGMLETVKGMVDDEEKARRAGDGASTGLVDPRGMDIG